ncbi:hypothetical protein, variant [Aphanomyces astaci]|uniref:MSP domain-containing protein n=1 Tax=Aphanomyces astaci TaxID=112090 RepID=W4G495_APHAT|nr:hypothetical protein, variant [Aphanomyces astaci]ETV73869.1 hypothetical protein, variant [Aphanomyces astaci]|eukprot:XP_009836804.1 hypothetical protein, variant [Aphanomyces astaci]
MNSSGAGHLITLEPADSLSFSLSTNSTPQAALTISNPSSVENVAFKVKTTRPMRYLVRPNQGVIGPNSSATVLVILQQKDCDELLRLDQAERQLSNDKFLVQSVGVEAEFCDLLTKKSSKEVNDDLTSLWNQAEKAQISNKKLRCRFTEGTIGGGSSNDLSTPQQLSNALLDNSPTDGAASSNTSSVHPPTSYGSSSSNGRSNFATASYASGPTDDAAARTLELASEMAVLRKKYDELVAFTVQLTAQRDTLINDLDKFRQQNQKLTAEQTRLKRQTTEMGTLRQRRTTTADADASTPRHPDAVSAPAPATKVCPSIHRDMMIYAALHGLYV